MEKPKSCADLTSCNNFCAFGTDESDPARHAGGLRTQPCTVVVEGEVRKPGAWDLEALLEPRPMEQRVDRPRCVAGWSMVVPSVGFPLGELVRRVDPPATPGTCRS